jgi:hypothetical protein
MLNTLANTLAYKCDAVDVAKVEKLRAWAKQLQRRNTPKVQEGKAKRKRDNKIVSRAEILTAAANHNLNARYEYLARLGSSFFNNVPLTPSDALPALLALPAALTRSAVTAAAQQKDGGPDFESEEELEHKELRMDEGAGAASEIGGNEESKFEILDEKECSSWSRRHPGALLEDLPSVFLALKRFPKQFYDEALGIMLFGLQNTAKPGSPHSLPLSLKFSSSFSLYISLAHPLLLPLPPRSFFPAEREESILSMTNKAAAELIEWQSGMLKVDKGSCSFDESFAIISRTVAQQLGVFERVFLPLAARAGFHASTIPPNLQASFFSSKQQNTLRELLRQRAEADKNGGHVDEAKSVSEAQPQKWTWVHTQYCVDPNQDTGNL